MKLFEITEDDDPNLYWDKYFRNPQKMKEKEDWWAQDPEKAAIYVTFFLHGKRFPKGEKAIGSEPYRAYDYACNVLNSRFPDGETAIATVPKLRKSYEEKFGVKLKAPVVIRKGTTFRAKLVNRKMFWLTTYRDMIGQKEPWGDTIPFDDLPEGTVKLYDVYSNPEDSMASDGYYESPELTIYQTPDKKIWFLDRYEWNIDDQDKEVTELQVSQQEFEKGLIPFTGSFKTFLKAWLNKGTQTKH